MKNHQGNQTCKGDFSGETDRRIKKIITDHNKFEQNVLKHYEEGHSHVQKPDFKDLGKS